MCPPEHAIYLPPSPIPAAPAGQRLFFRNKEREMLTDETRRQADIARLVSDLRAAKVELLSAQCASDRLRLQYSVEDIVSFGEPQTLKGAIASAGALCRFFSSIEDLLKRAEQRK
jgi:hypothetical protein